MADIYVYDVIGSGFMEDGSTAAKLRDELAALPASEPLNVRINSPGGDVFEAVAMKALLDKHEGPVSVFVDGLAASAASLLAMVGETISMADGAMMMIHEPWTVTIGDKSDHASQVELLDKIGDNIAQMYSAKSGKSIEDVRADMAKETWLTAEEAVDYGLATEAVESTAKAFAVPAEFGYRNAPKPKPEKRTLTVAAMQRQLDLTRAGAMV